ncbi:hypothetical protein P8452_50891 [Trifolium repens]|nr:hypothetical protein P8452_50891 [Trifolium repens]
MANPAMENVKPMKVKYAVMNINGSVQEIDPKCLLFERNPDHRELFNYHMDVARLEMLNAKNSTGGTSSSLMNKLNAKKIKELKEKILKKPEESKEVYVERPIDELLSFINGEDAAKDMKETKRNKKKIKKNKKNNEASTSKSKEHVSTEEDFDPAMVAAVDRFWPCSSHVFFFLDIGAGDLWWWSGVLPESGRPPPRG